MKVLHNLRRAFGGAVRSWFHLTLDEQQAVLLLVGLVLLGLAVRAWQLSRGDHPQPPPAPAAASVAP